MRGEVLEVHPAYAESAYRVQLFGDEIERIQHFDPLTGEIYHGHLPGEVEELISGVTHGGDHHHHLVAGVVGVHDPPGDALDARRVRHRGTAELLHDKVLGGGGRDGQRLRLRSGLDFR